MYTLVLPAARVRISAQTEEYHQSRSVWFSKYSRLTEASDAVYSVLATINIRLQRRFMAAAILRSFYLSHIAAPSPDPPAAMAITRAFIFHACC